MVFKTPLIADKIEILASDLKLLLNSNYIDDIDDFNEKNFFTEEEITLILNLRTTLMRISQQLKQK